MTPKYWLQTQAPAGNWCDSLGTNNRKDAERHGRFLKHHGEKCRVIERIDRVLVEIK